MLMDGPGTKVVPLSTSGVAVAPPKVVGLGISAIGRTLDSGGAAVVRAVGDAGTAVVGVTDVVVSDAPAEVVGVGIVAVAVTVVVVTDAF